MASGGGSSTIRIVLVGKTGAGKSSLGNVLLDKKPPKEDAEAQQQREEKPPERRQDSVTGFRVGKGLSSKTRFCDRSKADRLGVNLEVTDTPGLCDTDLPESVICREVAKSVALAEPGPHVIIFALRCDRRFTEEEYKAYTTIQALFSENINNYLILVFNGLDVFSDEDEEEEVDGDVKIVEQRKALDKEVAGFGGRMKEMVALAGGRYFGMDNKAKPAQKKRQVQDLIKIMQDLMKKNGRDACYKTDMTKHIMGEVDKMAEKEAREKGVSKEQATENIKRDIVEDKAPSGFFSTISGWVRKAAESITAKDMCAVM